MSDIRVMLVDDARFVRLRMQKILKPYVSKFWELDNGFAAVNLYKALMQKGEKPHLVLMDISMHLMNGKDATKKILEIDPDASIIIVSAINRDDWIRECIGLGIKDYIVKPFSDTKLIESFHDALGLSVSSTNP